jgi:hypothetical protein
MSTLTPRDCGELETRMLGILAPLAPIKLRACSVRLQMARKKMTAWRLRGAWPLKVNIEYTEWAELEPMLISSMCTIFREVSVTLKFNTEFSAVWNSG